MCAAVRSDAQHVDDVSVYSLDDQQPGAHADGPAIVEGPFFTARVPAGWRLDVTSSGDLIAHRHPLTCFGSGKEPSCESR